MRDGDERGKEGGRERGGGGGGGGTIGREGGKERGKKVHVEGGSERKCTQCWLDMFMLMNVLSPHRLLRMYLL